VFGSSCPDCLSSKIPPQERGTKIGNESENGNVNGDGDDHEAKESRQHDKVIVKKRE
jgi:hypothetical protein